MLLNAWALSDVIFFILLKKDGPQWEFFSFHVICVYNTNIPGLYPPIIIDDSSWKNAAESFTLALTLTIGGYESAIAPYSLRVWQYALGHYG